MSQVFVSLMTALLSWTATPAWAQPVLAFSQTYAEAAPTAHPPPHVTADNRYDDLIMVAAAQWHLDPFLLKGLLYYESRLQAHPVNKKSGATGIAQFTAGGRQAVTNLRRARGVRALRATFTQEQALNPTIAIPAAAELLDYLYRTFKDTTRVLLRYNGGNRDGLRHFVFEVIKHTNRLRTAAGLPPLPPPVFPSRSNRAISKLPVS